MSAIGHRGDEAAAPASPLLEASETLRAVLLLLTAASGLVDAVSCLALGHVFVANVTGNVAVPARGVPRPHFRGHCCSSRATTSTL